MDGGRGGIVGSLRRGVLAAVAVASVVVVADLPAKGPPVGADLRSESMSPVVTAGADPQAAATGRPAGAAADTGTVAEARPAASPGERADSGPAWAAEGARDFAAAEGAGQIDAVATAGPEPAQGPWSVQLVRRAGAIDGAVIAAVRASDGVVATTAVAAGQIGLVGSRDAAGAPVDVVGPGWTIPLDAVGIDPAGYAAFLGPEPGQPFARLQPGEALLTETSARLRGLGPGAHLDVTGSGPLTVVGVVPDVHAGTAEVVVDAVTAAGLGVGAARFLLVASLPDSEGARAAVAGIVAGSPRTLTAELGRGPWPPSWREVLPAAVLKERFGEFAYRPGGGRGIEQDSAWAGASIVTAPVPILGEVRCHRAVIEPLADALAVLEAQGLAALVDTSDYAGCHSARLIGAGAPVSRHAWGIAVDLNAAANPFGAAPAQDPRLVAVMAAHGFGYGGDWPTPDGMHFEYRGLP